MNKKNITHGILIVFYFIIFFTISLHAKTTYIIIHGTWAHKELWQKPGGDFYEGIKKYCNEYDTIIPFTWSGTNSFGARDIAGAELAQLIANQPQDETIVIVGHSHGGNVAIKASQLLTEYTHSPKIYILYTLGTPITERYEPDMNTIQFLYNFFSFEDLVQPIIGGCYREFPVQERVANISVVINNKEPDHSGIHCTEIAEWIPHMHAFLQYASQYDKSLYYEPGRLHLYKDKNPKYKIDDRHQERVDRDIALLKLCVFSLCSSYPDWRPSTGPNFL